MTHGRHICAFVVTFATPNRLFLSLCGEERFTIWLWPSSSQSCTQINPELNCLGYFLLIHLSFSSTYAEFVAQYSCSCGRGCKSYYPCLLLYCHVRSARLDGDTARGPVVLYDDDWQQMFVVNTDNDEAERVSISRQSSRLPFFVSGSSGRVTHTPIL